MAAILKEEPPELTRSGRNISPALDRIVRTAWRRTGNGAFTLPVTSRLLWRKPPPPADERSTS